MRSGFLSFSHDAFVKDACFKTLHSCFQDFGAFRGCVWVQFQSVFGLRIELPAASSEFRMFWMSCCL